MFQHISYLEECFANMANVSDFADALCKKGQRYRHLSRCPWHKKALISKKTHSVTFWLTRADVNSSRPSDAYIRWVNSAAICLDNPLSKQMVAVFTQRMYASLRGWILFVAYLCQFFSAIWLKKHNLLTWNWHQMSLSKCLEYPNEYMRYFVQLLYE